METAREAGPFKVESGATGQSRLTLLLCFCIMIVEGIEVQSIGLTAPRIALEFGLDPQRLGAVLSASPLGLFFGAYLGGRLADMKGHRNALVISMVAFGIFQGATAFASDFYWLFAVRFVCGLGLGGALPNLIVLTSNAAAPRNRILNVVITVAGLPIGGVLASAIVLLEGSADWRVIFYVGGVLPLVLAGFVLLLLEESRKPKAVRSDPRGALHTLFGEGRALATVTLWIGFCLTTLMIGLLTNWLPTLMQAKGSSASQMVFLQMMFGAGAAVGSVAIGWAMQRNPSKLLLLACYAALGGSLTALALIDNSGPLIVPVVAMTGGFLLGTQALLYGFSPLFYPAHVRGTGTGAAISAARLGQAVGPVLVGALLAAGQTSTGVLLTLLPITLVAAGAATVLLYLSQSRV